MHITATVEMWIFIYLSKFISKAPDQRKEATRLCENVEVEEKG